MNWLNRSKKTSAPKTVAPESRNGPNVGSSVEVKPDPNKQTTRISKRAMYTGVAILGLAGLSGFEYLQQHPLFGNTQKTPSSVKVGAAKVSDDYNIPPAKPRSAKPQTPSTPATDTTAKHPGKTTASTSPTNAPKPPVKPKVNPYAAQDSAFQSTLGESTSGASTNALSWKVGSDHAPRTAAKPLQQATPLSTAKTGNDGQKKRESDISNDLVKREVSPYELLQGSVIPAVLQTGIKSYLPGELIAVVSENVYSSVNGASLLVPAGSKLIGTYNTSTTLGVNRLAVAWTRIEFPNGTYINLPGFNGAGGQGYSGFSGEVNDHTWLIFKNALLMSIVDAGMAVASPSSSTSATGQVSGNTALQDSEQSLAQTFGQAESQLLEKYIDIAPTITIKPGYVFQVVATQDMVFPGPYNPQMQTGSGKVEQPKQPTEANPYS